MKKLLLLLSILISQSFSAQCNEELTKMLILGDSWAFFSWTDNSYNNNLDRFGLSDIDAYSKLNFAVTGAWAGTYLENENRVADIEEYIAGNPDLKIVHLSLGGNDIMGKWNIDMTNEQTTLLLDSIMTDLRTVIDTLHYFNPDLDIHISGYDYSNFDETVGTTPEAEQPSHFYFENWDNMGQPVASQVNEILQKVTDKYIELAGSMEQVTFVNNLGLMQWEYGQIENLTVPPYDTYPANTVPVPGGMPLYPSPLEAMNFNGNDSFHLSNESFDKFIKRHFEEFYWEYFRDADISITADNTNNNGWVSPITYSTANILIGRNNGEDTRAILSFDTSVISEDSNIKSASIYLQKSGSTGLNLTNKDLQVSIVSGFWGDDISLDPSDFDGASAASEISCTYGSMSETDYWYRIDLTEDMLGYINRTGTTQLKLDFDIILFDRYFQFYNDPEKIILDIKYEDDITAVSTDEIHTKEKLIIYPNPSNGTVYIKNISSLNEITIFDLYGNLVLKRLNSTEIDISNLASGMYIMRTFANGNIWENKIVKK